MDKWSHVCGAGVTGEVAELLNDIPGFMGGYKVSNSGAVFSLYSNMCLLPTPRKLKPYLIGGYPSVQLYVRGGGKGQHHYVHRLVAEGYLPNPDYLPMVNHMDGNKRNNSVDNLEWCTAQYNAEHAAAKSYQFINPLGLPVTIYNLKKYCKDNNLNSAGMYGVNSGRLTAHKGWILHSPITTQSTQY